MKQIVVISFLVISILLASCRQNTPVVLEGMYQSEHESAEYIVQMVFHPEEKSFVEYIENREVDRGTYEIKQDQTYTVKSDKQTFDIRLNEDNRFDITYDQLNNGKTIQLKNVDTTPTYIGTKFEDVAEYEKLIQ